MHPKDYLYAVALSVGVAVVCERCQATIAVTFTPADAATIIAAHTCTSRPERVTAP
jgi:phage terminase large subunit-like protein